jgi:hypothetical protein
MVSAVAIDMVVEEACVFGVEAFFAVCRSEGDMWLGAERAGTDMGAC